jgi:hypothetical protein
MGVMAMGDCERCGDAVEWKNAAGHYRDVCEACAQAVADARDPAGMETFEGVGDDE